MYYALFYDTVPDYLELRTPFRQAHLAHAERAHKEGKLILAGAYAHPADGALFVFRTKSSSEVEDFARKDPYVINRVVTSWRVREWTVVVGEEH